MTDNKWEALAEVENRIESEQDPTFLIEVLQEMAKQGLLSSSTLSVIVDCSLVPQVVWNLVHKLISNRRCSKLNQCYKVQMVLDKDLLDFQYTEVLEKVCKLCQERPKI
jgi:hypothetical protein